MQTNAVEKKVQRSITWQSNNHDSSLFIVSEQFYTPHSALVREHMTIS